MKRLEPVAIYNGWQGVVIQTLLYCLATSQKGCHKPYPKLEFDSDALPPMMPHLKHLFFHVSSCIQTPPPRKIKDVLLLRNFRYGYWWTPISPIIKKLKWVKWKMLIILLTVQWSTAYHPSKHHVDQVHPWWQSPPPASQCPLSHHKKSLWSQSDLQIPQIPILWQCQDKSDP